MRNLLGGIAAVTLGFCMAPAIASAHPCYSGTVFGTTYYFRYAVEGPALLVTNAEIAVGAKKTLAFDANGFIRNSNGNTSDLAGAAGSIVVQPSKGALLQLHTFALDPSDLSLSCTATEASIAPTQWSCSAVGSALAGEAVFPLTRVNNEVLQPLCRLPQ